MCVHACVCVCLLVHVLAHVWECVHEKKKKKKKLSTCLHGVNARLQESCWIRSSITISTEIKPTTSSFRWRDEKDTTQRVKISGLSRRKRQMRMLNTPDPARWRARVISQSVCCEGLMVRAFKRGRVIGRSEAPLYVTHSHHDPQTLALYTLDSPTNNVLVHTYNMRRG